jgi:hypothetical protein
MEIDDAGLRAHYKRFFPKAKTKELDDIMEAVKNGQKNLKELGKEPARKAALRAHEISYKQYKKDLKKGLTDLSFEDWEASR